MSHIEPILKQLVDRADQKKAGDISVFCPYDQSIADYFVVLSVQNSVHARALREELDLFFKELRQSSSDPELSSYPKASGEPDSGWIILDANVIIVHIISQVLRADYRLDELFLERASAYHL
jgi:ribosome-associated protein